MADEIALMAKLISARVAVDAARRSLVRPDDGSLAYLRAQILYLQATVHHSNLMMVMQAERQQRMSDEIVDLRSALAERWLH